MKQPIPLRKQSKKAQREQNARQRSLWPRSPVTRITPSKKAYDRRREKQAARCGGEGY